MVLASEAVSSKSESESIGSSAGFMLRDGDAAGICQLDDDAEGPPACIGDGFAGGCDLRFGSSPACLCSRFQPTGSVSAEVSVCSEPVDDGTECLVDVLLSTGSLLGTGVRSRERSCGLVGFCGGRGGCCGGGCGDGGCDLSCRLCLGGGCGGGTGGG